MIAFCANSVQQSADGAGRPALLADDLTDVAGGDPESQEGGVGFDDGLNGNPLRMID